MTALIDGEDPEIARQGFEDAPIGEGVETIGMKEDEIDRSPRRAEIEGGKGALPAPGKGDGAVSERGRATSCRRPRWPAG
ncbi:MAG TPA: hypothetical protein VG166_07740 [Caulobacteraceae bacterium]|nr:hypothetical protein [Caulobacteraceae bacterium]